MAPQSSLQRSGAHISGQTGAPLSSPHESQHSAFCPPSGYRDQVGGNRPAPATTAAMNNRIRRQPANAEGVPKAIWSDSVAHLGEEQWPAHSVPLFVFNREDRPRPSYREEVEFLVVDDRYINFSLRLRCGTGDRYMGGSVGLVQCPEHSEAAPGDIGQLVTITDIVVQPDNSVVVTVIGDLDFTIIRAWSPRGLQGLQIAFVEMTKACVRLEALAETCASEPNMTLFARMLQEVPALRQALQGPGPFTAFVPTNDALCALFQSEEELLEHPNLEGLLRCHVCLKTVSCEAMYSGRALQALDGTSLIVTFTQWPRGNPCVNDIQVEHMDIMCANGVIHTINGLLEPMPSHGQRRPRVR